MPICKRCGKEVDHVSNRGLCVGCGWKAIVNAATQMHERKGPIYDLAQARRKEAAQRKRELTNK